MLKLDLKLTREQKSIRLGKIRDRFAPYFGFVTSGSIAESLALNQAINTQRQGEPLGVVQPASRARIATDPNATQVFSIFLDGGNGALKAISDQRPSSPISNDSVNQSIKGKIDNLLTPQSQQNSEQFSSFVQLHYSEAVNGSSANDPVFHTDLDRVGFGDGADEQEARLRMSAFRMIHPLLAPGEKNADLLTIFFNAFPTLELVRATPVLDIKMYSSRQVFQDGKLAALSLQKSLEGAVPEPPNGPLRAIGLANQITASAFGDSFQDFQNYSIVGMELFRAPQTMVNPDATRIKENFLAPVIDPFRPLASIKSFDVDVKSAVGLISTKTAKLEIVLHDRSRMGEFADIIKPDRYGSSFIEVEYGWSHPDQMEHDPNSLNGNPYADILNLTRTKEHYNITNSSFSFDEVGQVNISLNLVTRGASEMTEISITGNQERLRAQLSAIANISKEINRLSAIAFGNESGTQNNTSTHRQEIRGHQMLGAAGDATNMLVISAELLTSLQQLRGALDARTGASRNSTPSSPRIQAAAAELRTQINNLVGPANGNSTQAITSGSIAAIQTTINGDIATALKNINQQGNIANDFDADIFLKRMPQTQHDHFRDTHNQIRVLPPVPRGSAGAARRNEENQLLDAAELSRLLEGRGLRPRNVMSLGTLFMALVAKPLAMVKKDGTPKFEEVQVYFYNFNNKASRMSHCNISQFPVNIPFFAREYSRMRLENLNRSVNLTTIDFVNFLANKIVDDPMNPAYGINDLYRYNHEGQELEINTANGQIGTNQRTSQDNFNRLMNTRMESNNIGHSPDFQMPQLTLDIESVPYSFEEGKTILKLHLYDKACSSTAPLRELLSLSTENLMSNLSSFPANEEAAQAQERASAEEASATQVNSRHHRGHNTNPAPAAIDPHSLRAAWRDSYSVVLGHADRLRLIEPVNQAPPSSAQQSAPAPRSARNTQYRFSGGPKRLKEMVMQYVPHIIYGSMYSTVKSANLSTQQNAQLASINMLRSLNGDPVSANGEQAGGVPLSVYPCELSITTLGCPFIRYSQEIFVDFNTNTTADNIYYVTGLTHKIEAGNYETTIKLTPNDAFGQYRNLIGQLNSAGNYLYNAETHGVSEPNTPAIQQNTNQRSGHNHHRRRR